MENTLDITFIYGVCVCLSLMLFIGYCTLAVLKERNFIGLFFSVLIINIGYLCLSVSKTLEAALMSNRLAYAGSVFLPLFMLCIVIDACKYKKNRVVLGFLITLSVFVFILAASQGYSEWYYREVDLVFLGESAKLQKVYGPLHIVYYIYLFSYFLGICVVALLAGIKKKITVIKHIVLIIVIVMFNIVIWWVEQGIKLDFEFLSVSYIASSLLLLLVCGMMRDYEQLQKLRAEVGMSRAITLQLVQQKIPLWTRLSEREQEVLLAILQDKKRKEVAEELCISENTVKKHITNIYTKLEISGRNELLEMVNKE